LIAFRTDGALNYIQDANGNRITAGYSGSLLTSLTHSDGSSLALSYNTHGCISQIADSSGRITTYTYDASGQYLVSVTTPTGTVGYSYVPDTTGPAAFALASITSPANTHIYFTYDTQGRLAQKETDGGTNKISYAYDLAAYSETDAANGTTVYRFDDYAR